MSNHIDPSNIIPCHTPSNKNFKNLFGMRFGRLVAESIAGKVHECGIFRYCWICRCDCGNTAIVKAKTLTNGTTQSCGCFQADGIAMRNAKHGKSFSGEYRSWSAMMTRCTNPNSLDWKDYGGRGIRVCDRWFDFRNFEIDMGQKPSAAHSIERLNNGGNYEPGNCAWKTNKEQSRNRRTNRLITFNGETLCVAAWEERLGRKPGFIFDRLNSGWSVERAITEPIRTRK